MKPISIGNFDYTKDDKGEWVYTQKDPKPAESKVKPKYREKPQFPLQEEIESKSKKRFQQLIKNTTIALVTKIKKDLK